jgi:ABC-type nitrate/sulfonate/bicarbonate transport system ATPase subunit
MRAPGISARALQLAFPGAEGPLPVLAGTSFDVAPGEFVALVGTSGCGKSTLLDVLAGLRSADRGDVCLDGDAEASRLGRLTLMPQRDALMPWRTALDNVALGAELAGLRRAEARRAARAALVRYGLQGFEDYYPHALSGGMRQRAALARTLLAGRRAWLLDEPFGAVDALTRADLVEMLEALWREHRPTVVLVTHDLDEALLLADRVLVLTPRPAHVAQDVAVDLPRPRGSAARLCPEFAALRARLFDALGTAGAAA